MARLITLESLNVFVEVGRTVFLGSCTEQFVTSRLLMELALGKISACPRAADSVRDLEADVVTTLSFAAWQLRRYDDDRHEFPIDYRYLDPLLRAASDPGVGPPLVLVLGCHVCPRCSRQRRCGDWQSNRTH